MTKTLTLAAALSILAVSVIGAKAESFPHTKQKQCSIEFRAQPKESRGGFEGWRTFYRTCRERHTGDTFAGRGSRTKS